MKKFNWGWGIAIFYSVFVIFMMGMVWRASHEDTDMVTENYYNKELVFQKLLDKENRANQLPLQLQWKVSDKKVTLKFPESKSAKNVKAQILFYRPSDSSKDFTVDITPDSTGNSVVESDKFVKGQYRMQVDWSAGGETYFNEGVIKMN
jgi:hypothetical protein